MKVPYFPMVAMTIFFVKRKLKVDSNLYSPAYNIDKITAPIFLVNGDNDDLVSIDEAKKLLELCPSPKKDLWIVKGASHAKCPETAGIHFAQKTCEFFLAKRKN